MILREELRRRLLADRGVYVKECCDKCTAILGPVRFTRAGELGAWCSRACRGDADRPVRARGGRPRKYKTDALRQRAYRYRVSGVTKPVSSPMQTKDLQAQKQPL